MDDVSPRRGLGRLWRRPGVRRVLRRMPFGLGFLLLMFVVFPWVGYHTIAPAGWHNASVHGLTSGMQYTVSADTPGLLLACGERSETVFRPSLIDVIRRCWRSRDGGETWDSIAAPFQDRDFYLVAPRRGGAIFFAVEYDLRSDAFRQPHPEWVWETENGGTTWRHVGAIQGDLSSIDAARESLTGAILCDSVLYTLLLSPVDPYDAVPRTFAFSADGGGTWTAAERAPSALERRGWQVYSFAADYTAPHSWLRTLTRDGAGATLERSTDDGRSWIAVGPVGDAASQGLTLVRLATNPARPGMLCAADYLELGLWLAASGDGGHTWRGGAPRDDFSRAGGHPPADVRIGDDGSCYVALEYQVYSTDGQAPASVRDWWAALLRLGPSDPAATTLWQTNSYGFSVGAFDEDDLTYVSAASGRPARLVVHANMWNESLPGYIAGMGGESSDDLLVWRDAA